MTNTDRITNRNKAMTIIGQMGGAGQLSAMVGVKHYIFDANKPEVRFRFKGSRKVNLVIIELTSMDVYNMKFYQLRKRGLECKLVETHEGVYCDQLVSLFEATTGLYITL